MKDEIVKYKEKLEKKLADKSIWENVCLTIEEAGEIFRCRQEQTSTLLSKQKSALLLCQSEIKFLLFEKDWIHIFKYINAFRRKLL